MNRYEKLLWLKQWYNDHRGGWTNQPSMVNSIRADRQARDIIYDLYFALTNKTLGGCGSCESDALLFLMSKSAEKQIQAIMECRFKLKQGVLLTDPKRLLPNATIANLTDEIAIGYLKDNPLRADLFEVIPEDWDKEPEAKTEEMPKAKTTRKRTTKR